MMLTLAAAAAHWTPTGRPWRRKQGYGFTFDESYAIESMLAEWDATPIIDPPGAAGYGVLRAREHAARLIAQQSDDADLRDVPKRSTAMEPITRRQPSSPSVAATSRPAPPPVAMEPLSGRWLQDHLGGWYTVSSPNKAAVVSGDIIVFPKAVQARMLQKLLENAG